MRSLLSIREHVAPGTLTPFGLGIHRSGSGELTPEDREPTAWWRSPGAIVKLKGALSLREEHHEKRTVTRDSEIQRHRTILLWASPLADNHQW